MAESITLDEKRKITIPKKMCEAEENLFWMLVSELSLKKTWDNPYDEKWY